MAQQISSVISSHYIILGADSQLALTFSWDHPLSYLRLNLALRKPWCVIA